MTTLFEAPPLPLPPPIKKNRKWMWIAGIVVTAIVGISIGSAAGKASVEQAAAPAPVTITAAAPPAVTVTAKAAAPVTVTAAAPPAVTVTAAAPPAITVTAAAPPAATVTAPAAAANAASTDPSGPKKNGSYLVGSQITPGNWQCTSPGSGYLGAGWETYDSSHNIVDVGTSSIATISDAAFSAEFLFCASTWTIVG